MLSPAKLVLLAVHLTVHADINGIRQLAAQYTSVLRKDMLIRVLLTYLPETLPPSAYVGLVQEISNDELQHRNEPPVDSSPVDGLSDKQAQKRVRQLQLLELSIPEHLSETDEQLMTSFLYRRAYKIEDETGMLNQVVDLLIPFLDHTPALRIWIASTILPLFRRNFEYYPSSPSACSLREFEKLNGRASIEYLLSQTGRSEDEYDLLGRDLRGILGPWLYDTKRWTGDSNDTQNEPDYPPLCSGWEQFLDWILLQASRSWRVSVYALEQWSGPREVDFGNNIRLSLPSAKLDYLDETYRRAALASAYLIPEGTDDALDGAYRLMNKVRQSLGYDTLASVQDAASDLPLVAAFNEASFSTKKVTAASMRNDLLDPSNPLTSPRREAMEFLQGLIISALILTRLGMPCSVRRAGDLVLFRDVREQKGEVMKLIRLISSRTQRNDDKYWDRVRREILWLHNWGNGELGQSQETILGVFGLVSMSDIEAEILKALLSNGRYILAKSLYEDSAAKPLPTEAVQEAVYYSALDAFDNASNPNRNKGGLKKCNDIVNALPRTVMKSLPTTKQIEALLNAAHALSNYRLVLKQGEPFSPVVLRVHSDPISIIGKVLDQNPGAYARLQEFLEMGHNLVVAGFPTRPRPGKLPPTPEEEVIAIFIMEKRITAMCISAALEEDDFETAYSYVASRLGPEHNVLKGRDEWSWTAAWKAGQYVRTARSKPPTHLGTASGNLEIRHLEQRLECLATALRVAPSSQLQDILGTFSLCEEQLDSAIVEEAAKEAAWDTAGDMQSIPGSFDKPDPRKAYPARNITASTAARQTEEAPMSLFDLSRATARLAQRNLTSLASLQGISEAGGSMAPVSQEAPETEARVRKRDQFREAATGTLVSGVGWLIGANVNRSAEDSR